ncbi:MAG: NusG domain II-containing protein [Spirochaetaceae bacterium]
MALKPFDYVSFAAAVLVVVGFSMVAYGDQTEGTQVRVETEQDTFIYSLEQSREFDVEGPLGHTHVEIDNGRVRVTASPCREKICVAAGWVSRADEWIACLPNRVFLRVQGGEDSEVDAQTF